MMAETTKTTLVRVVSLDDQYRQILLKSGETLHMLAYDPEQFWPIIPSSEVSDALEKAERLGQVRIEKVKGGEA